MLRAIFLLASIVALASAAEDPDWPALEKLFGQDSGSQVVKDFVTRYQLGDFTKGSSGSFTPHHRSYSLLYRDARIGYITLRLAPWPDHPEMKEWRTYTRPLPGGLLPSDDRKTVEAKLGQPTTAGGDRWMSGALEVWVHFTEQGAISEVSVEKAGHERENVR